MFRTKKSEIAEYLAVKQAQDQITAFDALLADWLSGRLRDSLAGLGLKRMEIHVDWLQDYQCIGIQGRADEYYVDIQIEPAAFAVACDRVEPDDPVEFPLESAGQFYRTAGQFLCGGA